MGNLGIISSVDSLPIPEGPHVKDFDAAQKAAKIQCWTGRSRPTNWVRPILVAPTRRGARSPKPGSSRRYSMLINAIR
jgi:hypothetical protein